MSIGLRMAGVLSQPRPIDPALVGWWKLDGNLTDSSGKGNDGTGPSTFEPGVYGQAFLGVFPDVVDTDLTGVIGNPGGDILTMTFWVKNRIKTGPSSIFGSNATNRRGVFRLNSEGNLTFNIGTSSTSQAFSFGVIGEDFAHIAMTRTSQAIGGVYKFYINGELTLTEEATSLAGATAAKFQIGGLSSGANVLIDNAMIYNRALAPAEIRYVYESGRPVLL